MIYAFFARLWARVWPYIAAASAALGAVLAIRQSGKRAGRQEVEIKQTQATLKGVEDARNARSEIDALSDDSVRDRARQRMRNRAQ